MMPTNRILAGVAGLQSSGTRRATSATGGGRYTTTALVFVVVLIGAVTPGCVRRTVRITTEPPNARVFLNDQEIGRSEVSKDFLWYGDYDVIIRKEGFKTLKTHWDLKRPWYQHVPIDFFAEVLTPMWFHDVHIRHFVLEEQEIPTPEELIERANQTRDQALRSPP
ncbi:MAG: PEGA domain-containing protein [Planctomycetes bacterium]|nr:PEGA domain-containing protein [Planctomycetota bacterium]